jgi:hypothetical protein
MECSNPECKQELKSALDELSDNLYGDGPEGNGGVYGTLKRKVSYSVFYILVMLWVGAMSSIVTFGILHEQRLSKTETIVEINTRTIQNMAVSMDKSQEMLGEVIRILKAYGK